MAVSGLPTKCKTHAHYIAKMALDMIDAANGILIRGQPFKVKIHSYTLYIHTHPRLHTRSSLHALIVE